MNATQSYLEVTWTLATLGTSQPPVNILGGGKLKVVGVSGVTASKSSSKSVDTRVHPYTKPNTNSAVVAATNIPCPTNGTDSISPSVLIFPATAATTTADHYLLPATSAAVAAPSPDNLAHAPSDVQQVCKVTHNTGN
ncbi:hypothetical protein PoB_006349700 [Plakobranchus ocellatus]|uniref:Period n=1 Tax=Plakobranchus ocellatus TaxID=259542 RepID=A0AAV4CYJ9_9GAST|nr:hypothetical protein PoB_006349700 [Plakobranchus ocellatus]